MEHKHSLLPVLLSCVLASFLTPFMSSSINVALPEIGKEFSLDAITLSWISTSFLLAAAIFLVPAGSLSDMVGRKKIFKTGMLIYTVTSFLLIFSFSEVYLLIVRIFQGIGASMIFSTSVALLVSVYPAEKRGKMMGILVTSVYIGTTIGPVVGGFLTHNYGWRSLFILNTFLGLIATGFVFTRFEIHEEIRRGKFDFIGSFFYTIALSSLMFGFSKLPSTLGIIMTIIGLSGIAAFFYFEKKKEQPILDVSLLLRNKVFAFSNLAALINYASTFASGFLLSLYLQYNKGLSPDKAGSILIASPIMMASLSSFAGRLSDKIQPGILASTGMALCAAGLFGLFFISSATPVLYIVVLLIIMGTGFALFSSPNMNAIMSSVEKKDYGVASAMQSTMRLVGQMMSMGFVMIIFSLFSGQVEMKAANHPDLLGSIKISFLLFAVLCLGGIFISLNRGNLNREKQK